MTAQAPVEAGSRSDEIRIGIALSAMGFVLAGLGACVAILARDLREPTSRLALLSSGFAVGLMLVAVVGPRMLRRWAMPTVLALGSVVCAVGAVLIGVAPSYVVAITGGLLVGLGGALLVLVAPLMLNGPAAASRLSRVNAVASGTGIFAPLAIGTLDTLGPTGRLAMLAAAPPLLFLAFLTPRSRQTHQSEEPPIPVLIDSAPAVGLGRKWRRVGRRVVVDVGAGWLRVVLAVSVEFCFVVWAVARLVASGLPTATAALLGSAFPIGMAVGRAVGPIRINGWSPVVPSSVLAAVGTLLVSLFDGPAVVAGGLVVAGLGVAPLYPVTLAALVATPGISSARLAAVGALASGTAILVAPALLAVLARVLDLRTAYLITLPLLAVLLLLSRRSGRTAFV
ncbi:fucose permease [Kribbella aluminosa]|uniref:Fucose permease n=1 Tax=Kribbella aluminosa TaxID=416017 RepID=A0ABS4UHW3_9ACTN|nr:MFS transporter [Kribbella aluminosa]MBP2351214.1 fucose permease [Kribbella aluminosa]